MNQFKGYECFCVLEELDDKVFYIPNHKIVFIAMNWVDSRLKETSKEVMKDFRDLLIRKLENSTVDFSPKNLIQEVIDKIFQVVGE